MVARATNFFAQQEEARRNTNRLVLLFVLAVLAIIGVLYFALIWIYFGFAMGGRHPALVIAQGLWQPQLLGFVSLTVLVFVGVASLGKTLSLRSGGGSAVAKLLGGREVARDASDLRERRLLNVVDEMALASGLPAPRVFLLDGENGINAFAAGFSTSDAVVAVTRGCLDRLSRDELQGVIGHEYSHLLNGDSRLNLRLIGVLHGLLALALVGRWLASSSRGTRRDRGAGAIILVGLVVMVVGYIGVFAGRLIKAGISRQREFLADASSVQFTRNPLGISGALKKIGGFVLGSEVKSPSAEQVSHFFFGEGLKVSLFATLLATHPPLDERIRRVDPTFDGKTPGFDADEPIVPIDEFEGETAVAQLADNDTLVLDPADVVEQVGNPTPEHLAMGTALLASFPADVRTAVQTPSGAVAAIYALLLDPRDDERRRQLADLERDSPAAASEARRLSAVVAGLDERARLPLLDLALPALRNLSGDGLAQFLKDVETLVTEDGKLTLFEFTVQQVLARRLRRGKGPGRIAYFSVVPLARDLFALLAGIAQAGNEGDPKAMCEAFLAGWARLPSLARNPPADALAEPVPLARVGQALARLALAAPGVKQQTIDACAHCALADRTVTLAEAELLRAISASLDCPLPPFLEGA